MSTIICQSAIFSLPDFDDAKHAFLKLLGFFHYGRFDDHLPLDADRIHLPSDIVAGKCGNCLMNVQILICKHFDVNGLLTALNLWHG